MLHNLTDVLQIKFRSENPCFYHLGQYAVEYSCCSAGLQSCINDDNNDVNCLSLSCGLAPFLSCTETEGSRFALILLALTRIPYRRVVRGCKIPGVCRRCESHLYPNELFLSMPCLPLRRRACVKCLAAMFTPGNFRHQCEERCSRCSSGAATQAGGAKCRRSRTWGAKQRAWGGCRVVIVLEEVGGCLDGKRSA